MEWFIPVGIFRKKSNTLSAYHFARKFRWKILSNGTGIFLGTENRNGIQLYHLQNTGKFPLSLDMKPDTSNPNKWCRRFRSFR